MVNKSFPRTARLNKAILRELSNLFVYEVSDATFAHVSITAVKLTKDMKLAKIYYTLSDLEHKALVAKRISRLIPLVRSHIAKTVRMKKIPDFEFVFDEVFEEGFRIDKIIKDIKKD